MSNAISESVLYDIHTKGNLLRPIRIGAPDHLAARPLLYGLIRRRERKVKLVYDEPGRLAARLDRDELDAALIPSIEFLRGVGRYYVPGPALVARGPTGSLLLVTDHDPSALTRIAVDENSRTPLAVLRIVLDRLYDVTPDFCVYKGDPRSWCDDFDGALLAGNRGLAHRYEGRKGASYDLGRMWASLYRQPLVLSLWACNHEGHRATLHKVLSESRDEGIRNLSLLADGIAATTPYDGPFLYDYLSTSWRFQLGKDGEEGLRVLEESALEYQLVRDRRLERVLTG